MKDIAKKSNSQLITFCENVKFLRKRLGYTQKEMAKKLGIGIRSLSKIERCEVPPRMSCMVLFKIQYEFGIRPTNMFRYSLCESDILALRE